jgi:L-fuculose-phosphate aldolase
MTTPTGVCKGFLEPDDIVITDINGKKMKGKKEPSTELLMHLVCYRNRPDVRAVVHAHPQTCTGFAVAGIPLDKALLAEVVVTFGCIPIAPYGTPSTEELATSVDEFIKKHDQPGRAHSGPGKCAFGAAGFAAGIAAFPLWPDRAGSVQRKLPHSP